MLLAACLSKESGVFAVVLLLLLDLARWRRPGQLARYAVAGAALVTWALLRQAADVHVSELPEPAGIELVLSRLHLVGASYGHLLAWPWPLSTGRTVEYLREPASQVLLGVATGLGLLVWAGLRGRGLGLAGLAFAALAVGPSLIAIAGKGQ